jgi:hypothetical protein
MARHVDRFCSSGSSVERISLEDGIIEKRRMFQLGGVQNISANDAGHEALSSLGSARMCAKLFRSACLQDVL